AADRVGDLRPDAGDRLQILGARGPQRVERLRERRAGRQLRGKPLREILRGRPSDLRDAERVDDPGERPPLRALDAVVDVRRALLGEAIEVEELLLREEEQVGRIGHETALLQLFDERTADTLDIEAAARNEVSDPLARL